MDSKLPDSERERCLSKGCPSDRVQIRYIVTHRSKMFVAKELRKKSIAEYLLYMWQIEDTIRAYGCSLTRIRKEYIDRFQYTEEQKEEEEDWFGDLVRMMNQEGCRENGHLQINKVLMQDLTELHAQLLQS